VGIVRCKDNIYRPVSYHFHGVLGLLDEENCRYMWEDGVPVEDSPRPCPNCGGLPTTERHDSCLGTLPGVDFACCGHGDVSRAYVKFSSGRILRREESIEWFRKKGRNICAEGVKTEDADV